MRRSTPHPHPPPSSAAFVVDEPAAASAEWEVRPSGMLVQKRDAAAAPAPPPTIRVKVKYGSNYYEVYIISEATFGELKKRAAERVGTHWQDLKAVFKDRERDSAAFLDVAGVKDGSKVVVVDDPTARAKRLLEERRRAKVDGAAKAVSAVSMEVDRLSAKVKDLEAIVSKGGKVLEKDVLQLIELLMAQLIKLDGVVAEGDAKAQRKMQVRRVQKYVEALDAIKIKNTNQTQSQPQHQPPPSTAATTTAKWETFDSLFSPSTSTTKAPTTASTPIPRFKWELF